MVTLCNVFQARAGINLNPRSYEKAAYQLLVKVANQMHNRNFRDVRKAYDSVCGEYHAEMDKRWIVDIDTKDEDVLRSIYTRIEELHLAQQKPYKILAVVPSRSGNHIITNPFNVMEFKFEVEIHKNNPSNLFIPQEIGKIINV